MIPVPPGSASRRRRGNGFTMSKLRKSIKPASMYFQCSGTAITAIIWPATSSITTNPGSSIPLSRATTVEGGMPIKVTSVATTMAAGTSQADGSQWFAAHQSPIVTAEAQVPEPGCKCPIPKKVAISQDRRDLGTAESDVMACATILTYSAFGWDPASGPTLLLRRIAVGIGFASLL